jgi:hypothetical protein
MELFMVSRTMPRLVPDAHPYPGHVVHIVLNDFGRFGAAYVETGADEADRDAIVENIVTGQYSNPVAVVAFNLEEGWSRDVSAEICREVLVRAAAAGHDLGEQTMKFIEHHCGARAA